MVNGYAGKFLWADLSTGKLNEVGLHQKRRW